MAIGNIMQLAKQIHFYIYESHLNLFQNRTKQMRLYCV